MTSEVDQVPTKVIRDCQQRKIKARMKETLLFVCLCSSLPYSYVTIICPF
jgi:hypothetical protein